MVNDIDVIIILIFNIDHHIDQYKKQILRMQKGNFLAAPAYAAAAAVAVTFR